MQLSQKTKGLLELAIMTGIDSLANAHRLHHTLTQYAGWGHPSSYLRQMRAIREKGLLGEEEPSKTSWIPALTAKGVDAIAERVDPERFWNQTWDGLWRTVTFDIPAREQKERQRLNTWLKSNRFGHLQGSLWLSTRPYEDWSEEIAALNIDPRSVIFIEGKPLGALSNESVVMHSWPIEEVQLAYQDYLNFISQNPPHATAGDVSTSLADWFKKESTLWANAIDIDPLLPRDLHPEHYLGPQCWTARKQAFQGWSDLLNS